MNLAVLLIAFCCWGLLFLQALHSPPTLAPYFFLFSGVAQWVAGVSFVGAYKEVEAWFRNK